MQRPFECRIIEKSRINKLAIVEKSPINNHSFDRTALSRLRRYWNVYVTFIEIKKIWTLKEKCGRFYIKLIIHVLRIKYYALLSRIVAFASHWKNAK